MFIDILNHIEDLKNADVKFLLENVRMKKDYLDVITDAVAVEPVFINSKRVSAQNRPRFYWVNWEFSESNDKGILLRDVLIHAGEVRHDIA